MNKTPRWYHATAIKPGPFNRFVFVRQSAHDGQVIVFNGRHFIQRLSKADAAASYKLGTVVDQNKQEQTEENFQYYQNY